MTRTDRPIENDSDILDPVTVKVGEADDGDDGDDADDGDEGGAPTPLGSKESEGGEGPREGQPPPRRTAGAPGADPGPKGGRPPKPSSWKGHIDKQIQTATADLVRQNTELRTQIAQLMGRFEGMMGAGGGGRGAEPTQEDRQIADIGTQMQRLATLAANPDLTEQQRADLAKQYNDLDTQRVDIRAAVVARKIVSEELKKHSASTPSAEVSRAREIISDEFPRLVSDERAAGEAQAYYYYLVAQHGGQESIGLLREACQYIYTKRGWGGPSGFSRRERGAFESAPGTGAGHGGGRGDENITFSTDQLRMMRGSGVSPEEVAAQMQSMRNGRP